MIEGGEAEISTLDVEPSGEVFVSGSGDGLVKVHIYREIRTGYSIAVNTFSFYRLFRITLNDPYACFAASNISNESVTIPELRWALLAADFVQRDRNASFPMKPNPRNASMIRVVLGHVKKRALSVMLVN